MNVSGLLYSLDRFVLPYRSAVTGDAFLDPRGRYKRGGGLNTPVQLTVTLPTVPPRDAGKLKNSLTKRNNHSVIEEVD